MGSPVQPAFIVWFTGLSGAGKTTLSRSLRSSLAGSRAVEVLDGDEIRKFLSRGLGFSKEDRDDNVRRIAYVARVLARNGVIALAAAISPYADARREAKALANDQGVPFIEVHVHAELDVLVKRDVKGLYRRALSGDLLHFTGVTDPYEAPDAPDVVVRSDRDTVEEGTRRILALLLERGLLEG